MFAARPPVACAAFRTGAAAPTAAAPNPASPTPRVTITGDRATAAAIKPVMPAPAPAPPPPIKADSPDVPPAPAAFSADLPRPSMDPCDRSIVFEF